MTTETHNGSIKASAELGGDAEDRFVHTTLGRRFASRRWAELYKRGGTLELR